MPTIWWSMSIQNQFWMMSGIIIFLKLMTLSKIKCFWSHSLTLCCSACMSLDCPIYCHQYIERKRVPEHPPLQVVYSETLALKPWLLYQITRSLIITKMIFFIESSNISYCPVCGEPLPPDRRKAFLRELSLYPQLGCWYRTLITDRSLLEWRTPPALRPYEKGRCLYHRIGS